MKTKRKGASQASRGDYLRQLMNDYIAEIGDAPFDLNDLFRWARRNNRWEPRTTNLAKMFKDEMRRAAREEYYTDPQGRKVRKKHAIVYTEGETQKSLWADIVTAPADHMRLSLQQRRRGALGEVVQTKTDMDSYNDNNKWGAVIQMSFNFDEDLAEMQQPAEYPESPPPDDDGSTSPTEPPPPA
jgi:hypothetical protein